MSDEAVGSSSVQVGPLRSFVERLERLEEEKREIADQIKEVKAEAKAQGYDAGTLTKILALRRKDPDKLSEEDAMLELYRSALGI